MKKLSELECFEHNTLDYEVMEANLPEIENRVRDMIKKDLCAWAIEHAKHNIEEAWRAKKEWKKICKEIKEEQDEAWKGNLYHKKIDLWDKLLEHESIYNFLREQFNFTDKEVSYCLKKAKKIAMGDLE